MELQIRKLSSELLPDYLYFFENVAHTDYPEWDRCYCLHYCSAHNAETDLSDPEKRREYAIQYVTEGILQGYLAYSNENKVVGWVNANDRSNCMDCDGWVEMAGNQKINTGGHGKTKSIFCFTVAPARRGEGIAEMLLRRVCEDAIKEGYELIEGYPNKGESDMYYSYVGPLDLYKKLGFTIVGETNGGYIVQKDLRNT